MTYKIRISNQPATYAECHSEVAVDTREEAIVYLWALAKQDIPQYGIVWLPMGVEPMTNVAMFQAEPPASLQGKIASAVASLNEQDIESLVCQALNTVYEALDRYGDDPAFVDKITNAANEWAKECVSYDDDETPIQMGWVGSDGQP